MYFLQLMARVMYWHTSKRIVLCTTSWGPSFSWFQRLQCSNTQRNTTVRMRDYSSCKKKIFKGNQKIAHLVTRKKIKILTLSVYQNIRHLQGLSSSTPPPSPPESSTVKKKSRVKATRPLTEILPGVAFQLSNFSKDAFNVDFHVRVYQWKCQHMTEFSFLIGIQGYL